MRFSLKLWTKKVVENSNSHKKCMPWSWHISKQRKAAFLFWTRQRWIISFTNGSLRSLTTQEITAKTARKLHIDPFVTRMIRSVRDENNIASDKQLLRFLVLQKKNRSVPLFDFLSDMHTGDPFDFTRHPLVVDILFNRSEFFSPQMAEVKYCFNGKAVAGLKFARERKHALFALWLFEHSQLFTFEEIKPQQQQKADCRGPLFCWNLQAEALLTRFVFTFRGKAAKHAMFVPDMLNPNAIVRHVQIVEDVRVVPRLQNTVNVQQAFQQPSSSCNWKTRALCEGRTAGGFQFSVLFALPSVTSREGGGLHDNIDDEDLERPLWLSRPKMCRYFCGWIFTPGFSSLLVCQTGQDHSVLVQEEDNGCHWTNDTQTPRSKTDPSWTRPQYPWSLSSPACSADAGGRRDTFENRLWGHPPSFCKPAKQHTW